MTIYDTPQTKNPCYKRARPMNPVGILIHSTGANNKYCKRYVDAPAELGVNAYGNHWNKESATKCMHAFIGLDKDGLPVVAKTLPYHVASWGCGKGANGSYNRDPVGHIQFEVCEDGLKDEGYYRLIWMLAEDYCVYLCQMFGFGAHQITSHYEAAALGYASNHADPRHWMRRFGDSMEAFRARVAIRLANGEVPVANEDKEAIKMLYLYKGIRGEDVRKLQQALISLGYDVGKNTKADGIFGVATEAGVIAFQRDHSLSATGVWTDADQEALDNALTNGPPVNDDAPPMDKTGLLTELEGLNKRQSVIIAALKGVM